MARTLFSSTPTTPVEAVSVAWNAADALLKKYSWDAYSQNSANRLSSKPNCPQWRIDRCNAVETWINSIWVQYASVKYEILNGNINKKFDSEIIGPAPWTIWDIATDTP